ncbi:MAG TPA: HAD family hydrolase [Planktothrix sp.]
MPYEKLDFNGTSKPQQWAADSGADAYAPRELTSMVDWARHSEWKDLAAAGCVLLAAGTIAVATHGALSNLLSRGETAAITEREGIAGLSKEALQRLGGVKHFVFDMDRTLLDHDGSLAALQTTMRDELVKHTGLSQDFISDALAQTTKSLKSPYFWNRLDEIKPLQEHFPGVDLNERFADVSRDSKAAYQKALKAKPEVVEMLDYLHSQGKGVHVFTAGNPARALEKLNGAGILGRIDNVYTSGLNTFEDSPTSGMLTKETTSARVIALPSAAKATGSGYPEIIEHLSETPDHLAMTGDHPIEDIANSQKLGIFASKANWFRNVQAEGVLPDLELTDPSQFTNAVKASRSFTS